MKRKLALLLSLVMVLSLLTACSEDSAKSSGELPKENNGVSGKTYVIKLAHVLADSTASAQACVYFKELVEERTNGNVEVQVFSASALGNERDINENLNNGSIQMIYSSPGAMGNVFYPELQVLDAPWLFSSMEQAVAAGRDSNSTIGGFIKDIYDNTNVQILDMWYRAPRHIFTANTKITTPADCTGLKLRSPEIDVYFGALAAIGFSVTPVAYLHNMKVNGHIRVDLLDQILPAPASKILNIVTKISLVAILAVTAIFGFQLSMESTKITSTALDIPFAYIYGAIPVSACLMIWFSFVRLVEWIYVKTGHEDLLKAEE